ncbi:MAG: HelD family protein [Clostridium sp.]|uniref:HelD family protein n=1 Tax=Clostridium sp. TaxID=1506 RepID=UPI003F2AD73B
MLIGKELLDEEKYLEQTQEAIKKLLDKYIDLSETQDKEIVKHRRFLWDNRSELDEIEINENCSQVAMQEKMHSRKKNRIKTLERQIGSPYFARLDFKADGEEAESFYIGLSTVEDEENFEFLVFDWRSPVSTLFYDFEIGRAYYDAPKRRIEGTIEFNRQFNIKNGEIVFMHNSNESLCDESLGEMLGGSATDKMKNIVATIQKEQNDIIRNEDSKVLFIQGAAGSGKTSIALHRAAYILYKYRKELSPENILIFSPNEVFAEYISDVLPELGETNILQTTFENYSKTFLPANCNYESKNDYLEYIYSADKKDEEFVVRSKGMEYKNTIDFMYVLNEFTRDIPRLLTDAKPIIIDGKEIVSKKSVENTFIKRFKDIPFLNRIKVIKESIFSQVETKYLSDDDDFEYVEDKTHFYTYCKEQVNIQVDEMIKTVNSVTIYKMLWENISKYTDVNLDDIRNLTIEYLNFGEVKYEDITPIIYIRAAMEGFRNYSNVKHILIDEAQDYSPLFYEIIKKSFKDAAITIMGDLNQRIDKNSNVKNKEGITDIFFDVKTAVLTKSYRSTYNITNFTRELLKTHEPIEAIERRGENPIIYITKTEATDRISKLVNDMINKGYESIAIISKNREVSRKLYEKLEGVVPNINLIEDDKCEFKKGINIIPSYLSKGLEFDCVIVADGENYLGESHNNLFYTVCTRALHELHIIADKNIDEILPRDKDLYTIIE